MGRIIQGWEGLWDAEEYMLNREWAVGWGGHMGYFDIILADGVKLC